MWRSLGLRSPDVLLFNPPAKNPKWRTCEVHVPALRYLRASCLCSVLASFDDLLVKETTYRRIYRKLSKNWVDMVVSYIICCRFSCSLLLRLVNSQNSKGACLLDDLQCCAARKDHRPKQARRNRFYFCSGFLRACNSWGSWQCRGLLCRSSMRNIAHAMKGCGMVRSGKMDVGADWTFQEGFPQEASERSCESLLLGAHW